MSEKPPKGFIPLHLTDVDGNPSIRWVPECHAPPSAEAAPKDAKDQPEEAKD